jgi:hypothetical protein
MSAAQDAGDALHHGFLAFELAVNVAVVSPVAFQTSDASATMPAKVGSVGSSNFRVR